MSFPPKYIVDRPYDDEEASRFVRSFFPQSDPKHNDFQGYSNFDPSDFPRSGPPLRQALSPEVPKMPEVYHGAKTNTPYLVRAPKVDPNFVFVGNRDTTEGSWHRIGDPISPEKVGKTTHKWLKGLGDDVFDPGHHGINLPKDSFSTREDLQNRLRGLNVPFANEDRDSLFKRFINVSENPKLQEKLAAGGVPTELETADILNRHVPTTPEREAYLRGLRRNENPSERIGQPKPITEPSHPPRPFDQFGNRLGTGGNPMTIDNMGAKLGAEANVAPSASFASRAMPMMSLALMAGSLVQNSRANQQMEQNQEQEQRMRT